MRSRREVKRALLPLVAILVASCEPAPENEVTEEEPANQALPLPPLPVAEPPMDRAALLLAVAKAQSAAALGRQDSEQQRTLDGKRFEVRIRFGCATGVGTRAGGPFNVRFDEKDRTLRLRAAPDLTMNDPWIAKITDGSVEAIEGFWMRRPWLLDDGCPQIPAQPKSSSDGEKSEETAQDDAASPRPASNHRVGLAQFFKKTDPRTGRRDGRPYEATKVLEQSEQPSRQGYNLVLSGRLRKLPTDRVITCRSITADAPPNCVVSADFDRVWIEVPGSRSVVAEWSS